MKNEKWSVLAKKGDYKSIMNNFGVTACTARLLVNRGITEEKDIRAFLHPSESFLFSQKSLKGLERAADIIDEKLSSRRKIRVIGDYDVDGIMSTYILTDALKRLGAEADFYIPDRQRDGYGINEDIIVTAAKDKVDTIITCDNGIAAIGAAEEAKKHGMTLVITDHHEVPEVLPEASVIVDPKQEGDTYPCKSICGAVVAAKLVAELLERRGLEPAGKGVLPYLEFMAIATICDVVPLEGENRTIAALGLKRLNKRYLSTANLELGTNLGLKALIDTCELTTRITDYQIGFVIGPCLNATGRLDLAARAMKLLESSDMEEALEFASECRNLNEERKDMTLKETEKAFEMLEAKAASGIQYDRVLVVELPDCHESLAGIIAGRIREKYNRPTFVLTKAKDGMKGSGRSIPGYNMFGELQKCDELFTKYGGHPMAAGLSLPSDNVSIFRERLNQNCTLTDDDLKKHVDLDAGVAVSCFDEKSVKELELFYPCGQGNPSPLFGDSKVRLIRLKRIGKNNNYLRMYLEDSRGVKTWGICFRDADEVIGNIQEKYGMAQVDAAFEGKPNDIRLTICYVPEINEYNGLRTIQMKIQDFLF